MEKFIPLEEQETVITFAPARISRTADIYTCMPDQLKKLRELAKSRPECVRIKQDLGNAIFAEVEKSMIKIQPKRQVSEENREAAAERMKKRWRKEDDTD